MPYETTHSSAPSPRRVLLARIAARFSEHVMSLNALHANLMSVHRRTRAIRKHLLEQHPELQVRLRGCPHQHRSIATHQYCGKRLMAIADKRVG